MRKPSHLTLVVVLALSAALLPTSGGAGVPGAANLPVLPDSPTLLDPKGLGPEEASVVRYVLPTRKRLDAFVDTGVDLDHFVDRVAGGLEVHAIVTPSEVVSLAALGFRPSGVVRSPEDVRSVLAERAIAIREERRVQASHEDDVKVLRADYYEGASGNMLYIEAHHVAGVLPTDLLVATWAGADGTIQGARQMSRFTDSGEYMYHYLSVSVTERPHSVTVLTENLTSDSLDVTDWVAEPPTYEETYLSDFITHFLDPTEAYARIEAIHEEFPGITEIIELPHPTNGYGEQARATIGSSNASNVVVVSNAEGHEGGNELVVRFVDPGAADSPLSVSTGDNEVTVSLATNTVGAVTSTAAEVVAALNADAASLVSAYTYRGDAGAGVVSPAETTLDDGLDAPDHISREPFRVRALRLRGNVQPGEEPRVGVFIYSQEHAREWSTPLVAVEVAERLARNYATDDNTRSLLDTLDIFIVPSMNPDGSHYSFYDYASQRKTRGNHCSDAYHDSGYANSWGVDLNRNFSVGSRFDGYSGASSSCTSSTYSGPEELSEPEAKNEVWLVNEFPNIKFSMNVHSTGNYFMWPPGAYIAEGRVPLPRPTFAEESYFWEAGEHILNHVKAHRGTVVTPARTGPVIDVLYSAAGNSADEHWYNRGIFGWDFEVGTTAFQPPFAEGHEEAMEFANGTIGLLEVARDYANDDSPPTSTFHSSGGDFWFTSSEPATIHYTTDGSEPTTESEVYESGGIRTRDGEIVHSTGGTSVRWLSVDIQGNVEAAQQGTVA